MQTHNRSDEGRSVVRQLVLSIVVGGAAVVAAPVDAQHHPAPQRAVHSAQRDTLANILRARIASINARIDLLRDRGALSSAEAQELRKESRRLQSQLFGLSAREAGDVAYGITRLESRVGFAMDDARWGRHVDNGEFNGRYAVEDSYERFGRYHGDWDSDYRHFDRYTGSSVDRWHDPFDRGTCC
jgi:hypothetical protein